VQSTIDDLPNRSPVKLNIGVIQTNISMPWFDGIMCARSREYADQYMGIYVDDALRGKKIGKSLISAARIVLRKENVRQLVVDEITEITPGTQTGEFYRRLGGKIFYVNVDHPSSPKLSIPTKPSLKYPYRFE
jgi:GNAT superfamily N-acetyltransferase